MADLEIREPRNKMGVVVRVAAVGLVLLTAACAGNLPEPGSQAARPMGEADALLIAPITAPERSPDAAVDQALRAHFNAQARCDEVALDIPRQQLRIKKLAYNRKQGGLLVTTAVGVAGSVITAIVASNTEVKGTKAETGPATVAGASTAGATTIAGVISLFVVGTGLDDEIQNMSNELTTIGNWSASLDAACRQPLLAANAPACVQAANLTWGRCDAVARGLRYKVPERTRLAAPSPAPTPSSVGPGQHPVPTPPEGQ